MIGWEIAAELKPYDGGREAWFAPPSWDKSSQARAAFLDGGIADSVDVSAAAVALIGRALSVKPSRRPTSADLVEKLQELRARQASRQLMVM